MTKRAAGTALLMAGAIALAACGHSPETHLLTLDVAPPGAGAASYAGPALRVTAVHVPASIDRLEFARAVSPTELRLQDQYHWSASLGTLAREALLRDLAARLPPGRILPPDSPAAKGVRRVDVSILALTTDPERTTMEVLVTMATDGELQALRRQKTYFRTHAAGQDPSEAAVEYSDMLGLVADEIVSMART